MPGDPVPLSTDVQSDPAGDHAALPVEGRLEPRLAEPFMGGARLWGGIIRRRVPGTWREGVQIAGNVPYRPLATGSILYALGLVGSAEQRRAG